MFYNLEDYKPLKNHCELIGYLGFAGLIFNVFC
jgi:hypothetical protein